MGAGKSGDGMAAAVTGWFGLSRRLGRLAQSEWLEWSRRAQRSDHHNRTDHPNQPDHPAGWDGR
ncbi:MAG: hypothetical protein U0L14_04135, partial [Bifidobacterium ruminantium]|nr:hypothetical protein [Bifidobacterium ruminantium]